MSKRVNLIVFAFVLALGVAVVPAFAGKGGNGNSGGGGNTAPSGDSSSISIATVDGSAVPAATAPGSLTLKYGDTLTFASNPVGLAGNEYPMVDLACFEDVNNDGVVDMSVTGPDIVYSWLDHPNVTFPLGAGVGTSIWSLRGGTATCQATLYAYSMTGKGETIRSLANTATFSATSS